MNVRAGIVIAAVLLTGTGAGARIPQNESARILLEAARKKEVVDGNLEAAIQVYREILSRFPEDRSSGAEALLGLAQGLEKLGSSDALAAYDRIVREFSDQPAAAVAQTRRAALAKTAPGARPPQPPNRELPVVQARSGVSVSGRVIRLGHNAGRQVDLRNTQTGLGKSAVIARDGSFEFPSVEPGTWQANITPGLTTLPPIALLVGDRDIKGLEITLPLSIVDVSLTVRTSVEGGTIAPFQLQFKPIRPVSASGLPREFAEKGVRIPISAPTFQRTFPPQEFPPTEYRVRVIPPPPSAMPAGFVVKAIKAGSVDVLNSPLKISPSEPLELQVVLGGKAEDGDTVPSALALGDEANLLLRLGGQNQPRIVDGTVQVEDGGPVPRFRLRLDAETVTRSVPVNGSSFSASLPPDDYRTAVIDLPRGFVIRSIVDATSDLTFWPLTIAPDPGGLDRPQARPRITITLAMTPEMRRTRVSGRLVGGRDGLKVKLVGTILTEDLVVQVKPDGSFEFPRVYPDTYTVWLATEGIVSMRVTTIDVSTAGISGLEIDASRLR